MNAESEITLEKDMERSSGPVLLHCGQDGGADYLLGLSCIEDLDGKI